MKPLLMTSTCLQSLRNRSNTDTNPRFKPCFSASLEERKKLSLKFWVNPNCDEGRMRASQTVAADIRRITAKG
jgi:hypothetical protein